ncbi:MAG: MbcA/ParS/Xre antitoxin family protein [Acidiferrobacterales bacterium]
MHELSHEQRVDITRAVISILDRWGLSAEDQVTILALPPDTGPGMIGQYRESMALPDDVEVTERIEHLAGIADALRTSHPLNGAMDAIWMNTANHRFDDRTPLEVMISDGLSGVIAVRAHLDCTFDWNRLTTG